MLYFAETIIVVWQSVPERGLAFQAITTFKNVKTKYRE